MATRTAQGSGDLLADRRFAYAAECTREGDHPAAADLLEQCLERVPGWAPAWLALGLARERLDDPAGAADAFDRAEALDRDGVLGAGLHRARLSGQGGTAAMPAAYVAALFDDYAPRFDQHLVEGLGYRGPALLEAALLAAGVGTFGAVLDLGCGTGLMGERLRLRTTHLAGVDLSPAMVAQAARRGLYDRLAVGELVAFLAAEPPASLDGAVAADVFAYLGALAPAIEAAARALRSGGLLAFTVQHGADADVALGTDMRFTHSRAHVAAALAAAGLEPAVLQEASTRREAGAEVPGLVVVARKP